MRQLTLFSILVLLCTNAVYAKRVIPELKIEKISDQVFLHKSYQMTKGWGLVSSNGLVVVEDKKAYIIDTPWSEKDTQKLVAWIRKQGLKPVASISTHFHDDRSAGISWLNANSIPTYASQLTNTLLKKEGKAQAAFSFEEEQFWLAEGLIQAYYPGGGHSIDNIVVWLPKSKILYGGCLVRSLNSRTLGNVADARVNQWANSVANVITKFPQLKMVIPGHGKSGDINLLTHTKQLAEPPNKNNHYRLN